MVRIKDIGRKYHELEHREPVSDQRPKLNQPKPVEECLNGFIGFLRLELTRLRLDLSITTCGAVCCAVCCTVCAPRRCVIAGGWGPIVEVLV